MLDEPTGGCNVVPLPPSAILIPDRSIRPHIPDQLRLPRSVSRDNPHGRWRRKRSWICRRKRPVRSAAEGASLHRSPCPSRPPPSRYLITVYYSQSPRLAIDRGRPEDLKGRGCATRRTPYSPSSHAIRSNKNRDALHLAHSPGAGWQGGRHLRERWNGRERRREGWGDLHPALA